MSVKILQLHKRASYTFDFIQDKYAFDTKKQIFALADGTTQSFMSEKWSKILVDNFVDSPEFNDSKLVEQFQELTNLYKKIDYTFSDNPAKKSLEKAKILSGATATFNGIKLKGDNILEVIACGDTNLFIFRKEKMEFSFPYTDFETLDANQFFINTKDLVENKVDSNYFHHKEYGILEGDLIILATDAISRWIFQNQDSYNQFSNINDFGSFLSFCQEEWDSGRLQEDDLSLVIIELDGNNKLEEIIPPENFSFPKELEVQFKPTIKPPVDNHNSISMDEIRNQFNGVAKDFDTVKRGQKMQKLFSILTLGLLTIILAAFFSLYSSFTKVTNGVHSLEKKIETLSVTNSKKEEEIIRLKKQVTKLKKDAKLKIVKDTIITKPK